MGIGRKWEEGKDRRALAVPLGRIAPPAVLLGCLALLAFAPAALAAEGTGKISGTVTEAPPPSGGLENIEVTVYEAEAGESEVPVGSVLTNANGEYTVEGLASGSYEVKFAPGKSGLNYVSQYYKNKSSATTAEPVAVVQGKTTENIDAQLEAGGEISGTVTDAWTHMPLSNIYVVALGPGGVFAAVTDTNASGEYTLLGLASGVYEIEFIDVHSGSYIIQYYNNQSSPENADPVGAKQGETTPGIDAALVRKEPVNIAAPVISGTPAVGKTLSCLRGSWTGEPTLTYTYAWLRNGSAIAGAGASTYAVQSADQGTGLACRVTATNKNAGASAVSNTLTVPVPAVPPPKPEVELSSARIVVSGGSARVPIACASATCTGTIELTGQIVTRRRRGRRTIARRTRLLMGRETYTLSAGHSATILVHLTSRGKNALDKARHHRLPVKVSVPVTGGATVRKSVVLSELAHRHRRHP
jgi:hypothetical protein